MHQHHRLAFSFYAIIHSTIYLFAAEITPYYHNAE
jgi:hypothetical protein